MAKKKAAEATAGAVAVAEAARDNPYVQKIIDDDTLRDDLRTAFDSARRAYDRIDGKGPQKALKDKRVQKDLKQAALSLQHAADSLRRVPQGKRKSRKGKLIALILIAAGAAIAANEDLRGKLLDMAFGSEEEFQYSGTS
jgi:hypothetical protein